MYTNILLGVDSSTHAQKAAHSAGELARLTGANLWVVACFEPIPAELGQPFMDEAIHEHLNSAEQNLRSALAEIGNIPGELKTELLEGPPADSILSVAEIRGIDLIVMGTRGLGRFSAMLLGSQSQKVVSQAHCPVLLVR